MGTAPAFASVSEALDMVQAGLSYLAATDAAQLPAATQAECLRRLERSDAIATAARAFILAGFTAGQGYCDDAEYSAVSWLIHRTHVTRGAAVGHAAWAGRVATHVRVLAALAAGQVCDSVGRLICLWTGKLPEKYRDDADEVLIAAAAAGLGLEDLAALFAEMYQRARSGLPDQDLIGVVPVLLGQLAGPQADQPPDRLGDLPGGQRGEHPRMGGDAAGPGGVPDGGAAGDPGLVN